jgi:DNA gyrase subunit A
MSNRKRKTANADTDTRDWAVDFADGGKQTISLDDEIKTSMRGYIDYVLTQRSLPYISGEKPVITAILTSMWTHNIKPGTKYTKSATITGSVIGELWAHSADAVYLAMAGLTRDKGDDTRPGACRGNLCLFDGHGNFGASYEDKPASSRYTEDRLSPVGASCIEEIDNGAVFQNASFDGEHMLPEVLPVKLPILMINGSDGLAYGYNVSWLPHNPSEVIKALIHRMDNPRCTVKSIRKIMPGPDFPSGGIVIDKNDVLDNAYTTGFGTVELTSRYVIKDLSRGRHAIDFYETPYVTNRSGDNSIVSGIMNFAQDNPAFGITDVKDLSGGDNFCLIEVTVKSGIDAHNVANALISQSSKCQLTQSESYRQSIVLGDFERTSVPDATGRTNMLRLTNPKPTDIGIMQYFDAFIEFRESCVINALEREREKDMARKHLLEGMLKSLVDIDAVIHTIRHSMNKTTAKTNLKKQFALDDVQADYILGIPLSRLTRSDKIEIEGNNNKLQARIDEIDTILSSQDNVKKEIKAQLQELLKQQTLQRRTTIIDSKGNVIAKAHNDSDESIRQAITSCHVLCNDTQQSPVTTIAKQQIKVTGTTNVYLTSDGQVGVSDKKPDARYVHMDRDVDKNDTVMLVFDNGSSLRMKAYELPTKPTILQRKCVGIIPLGSDDKPKAKAALITSSGKVKVLDTSTLTKSPECDVITLDGNATVLDAKLVTDDTHFVFVTDDARLLTFDTSAVNPQGRTAGGVAGIKLNDANVAFGGIATSDDVVLTSTVKSSKKTPLSEYPTKGRGTAGVRCQKLLKGESKLTFAVIAPKNASYVDAAASDVDVKEGKRDASGTTKKAVTGYYLK